MLHRNIDSSDQYDYNNDDRSADPKRSCYRLSFSSVKRPGQFEFLSGQSKIRVSRKRDTPMSSENRHLTGTVTKSQIDQLERISKQEKTDRSSVLRKVLDIGLEEYNKRKAAEKYRKGKVSVGKAAEIVGTSAAEFYGILENEDIPLRVDLAGINRSLESDFGRK